MQAVVQVGGIEGKILDIDKLPTYEEARRLMHHFFEGIDEYEFQSRPGKSTPWEEWCVKNGVHTVYNVEFVDALAEKIRSFNETPVVEVCAGNGKLTRQLRKRGIPVTATDDYSWGLSTDENSVERLSHKAALEKYKPRIVVASWLSPSILIALDILEFQSVDYFIVIDSGSVGWLHDATKFKKECLKEIGRYNICMHDSPWKSDTGMAELYSREQLTLW